MGELHGKEGRRQFVVDCAVTNALPASPVVEAMVTLLFTSLRNDSRPGKRARRRMETVERPNIDDGTA